MKRGWFGAVLLLVLLGLGILSSRLMQRFHGPLAASLDQASVYALEGNWEQAAQIAHQSQNLWKKTWHLSATVSDHGPMEEVDSLFAQLEVYQTSADSVNFAAVCAALARQIEAMADAHELNWWNFL